jgi:predicted transcriptional regulator
MALAIVEDLKNFFESHTTELEHAAHAVEAVEANPAVRALLVSAHIPDTLVQALADMIQKLDEELGAKAAKHAQIESEKQAAAAAQAVADEQAAAEAAAATAAAAAAAAAEVPESVPAA